VGEYEGDLIASGHFTHAGGGNADAVARWDGSKWHAMGSGRELPLGLAVQDVDYPSDDSLDDVIIAVPVRDVGPDVHQQIYVYGCDGGTERRWTKALTEPLPYIHPVYGSRRQLTAADILGGNPSRLTLLAADTAISSLGLSKTRLEIYEAMALQDSTCGALQIPLRDTWTSSDQLTHLVAADLDTLTLVVGPPVYHRKTGIVQPLVVLGAPPVHYDVIRDTVWDVNFRYGANPDNCETFSTYKKKTGYTIEMKTEVNRDWGVSSSLDVSLGTPGGKVKAHLDETYGEGFSKVEQNIREIQLTATVTTGDDDQVYATQVDYDIWEYPVIKGGKRVPGGGIVVVSPNTVQDVFSAGKNPDREGWIPDHEVENVLSYPRLTDLLDNPQVASGHVITNGNTGFTLDEYPWSADWAVVQSDFSADEVEESWNAGFEVGVSASAEAGYFGYSAGVEASLEYEYSESEVQTYKTTVSDACSLGVFLGCINTGYGVVNYTVTPYAYWATSGALVLDYAVSPAVAQQGEDPTWWQVYYGESDPALLLPWRLDDDKGEPLTSEASRFKTKEIFFHPSTPYPGQDVTIVARVHNFGLTPTLGPVKVSFYLGDPDHGGVLLIDAGGFTEFETTTALRPQGSSLASMVWRVPFYGSIAECQRIWVVVDPLDEISPEVHDNDERKTNNKGWKLLRVNTDPQCIDTDGDGYGDPAYRCSSCPTYPAFDNCPTVPNPGQEDADGDGIGDVCEADFCGVAMTGDVNVNGEIATSDIIYLVNFVLKAGPPPLPCEASGDANCTGEVNTTDIILLVNYVLKAGPPPCDVCSLIPGTWGCP
jgi:hypothetical protein